MLLLTNSHKTYLCISRTRAYKGISGSVECWDMYHYLLLMKGNLESFMVVFYLEFYLDFPSTFPFKFALTYLTSSLTNRLITAKDF
jgi:hypothetical protein